MSGCIATCHALCLGPPNFWALLRLRLLTSPTSCAPSLPCPLVAGSSKDKKRIEQQLKEREEQHKQFEEAKKAAAAGAGLRQFGAASSEVSWPATLALLVFIHAAGSVPTLAFLPIKPGAAAGPQRLPPPPPPCPGPRRPSRRPSRTRRWAW